MIRLWVGWLIAGCVSCAWASHAWAQFDKSRWPASNPTPTLDVVDLQGKVWTAQDLAGHVVVLNFWATWCAPCKEEMPTLQTLHDIRDDKTLVLAVNVREPSLRVARYVQATGLTLPVLLDPKGELAKRWGVSVYPTTVLLAPDGQARWRVMGDVDWSGPESNRWLTEVRQDTRTAHPTGKTVPLKR